MFPNHIDNRRSRIKKVQRQQTTRKQHSYKKYDVQLNRELSWNTKSWQTVFKCSSSLDSRKIQVKTTLRFHVFPNRWPWPMKQMVRCERRVCFQWINGSRWWTGHKKGKTLIRCWWKYIMVQEFWKSV